MTEETRQYEWLDYYKKFSYFSIETVRDGCYPRIMEHSESTDKAIILVHGLSDSPYFMTAIGDYFFNDLNYNVYIPLLHCHGLREPKGMEGVELEEWKANVSFAIKSASSKCDKVSIGGLSTGGTLSFYMAATNPKINGDLYLFSAALDLAEGLFGLIGELKERLLLTFLADLLDNKDEDKPLIRKNPYRYDRIDIDGAQELARLINETDHILNAFSEKHPFPKRVFAAHSKCDTTADISGIKQLQNVSDREIFHLFEIPKDAGVSHASLVLKDPITPKDEPEEILEEKNPQFGEMLEAIRDFESGKESRTINNILSEFPHFEPEFDDSGAYNKKDALSFALACQLAYAKDPDEIKKIIVESWGEKWKEAQVFPFDKRLGIDIDTQGFVAANEENAMG